MLKKNGIKQIHFKACKMLHFHTVHITSHWNMSCMMYMPCHSYIQRGRPCNTMGWSHWLLVLALKDIWMSPNSSLNRAATTWIVDKHVLLNWPSHPQLSHLSLPLLYFCFLEIQSHPINNWCCPFVVWNCLLSFITNCAQSYIYGLSLGWDTDRFRSHQWQRKLHEQWSGVQEILLWGNGRMWHVLDAATHWRWE